MLLHIASLSLLQQCRLNINTNQYCFSITGIGNDIAMKQSQWPVEIRPLLVVARSMAYNIHNPGVDQPCTTSQPNTHIAAMSIEYTPGPQLRSTGSRFLRIP